MSWLSTQSILPFNLAWRYVLAQQKSNMGAFISRMSIAGLAISVALLIAVLSVMNGFEKEMRERILGLLPQITLYSYYQETDWDSVVNVVEKHPSVIASAPYLRLQGLLVRGRKTEAAMLFGIDPEQESKVSVIERYISKSILTQLQGNQVIIGQSLATHLQVSKGATLIFLLPQNDLNNDVPQILRLHVLDILDSGTEIDRHALLAHIDTAKAINQLENQALRISINDLFAAPQITNEILRSLPRSFTASNWTKTHGNLYSAINLSKRLLLFLMLIVISVAMFNIVSSLVLMVNNKRGDIAILRTLGMSPQQVMATFVLQGSIIAILGTLIGLLLSIPLLASVNYLVSFIEETFSYQLLNPDVYPLSYLPVDIRYLDIIFVCSCSILIGTLATLYPAWRASHVQPASALSNVKV